MRFKPDTQGIGTSGLWQWRTKLLGVLAVLAPAIFLVFYRQQFGYEYLVVPLGLTFFLAGLGGWAVAATLAAQLIFPRNNRFQVMAVAGAIGVYLTFVALVYAGAYMSNSTWGDTINYRLVHAFAMRSSMSAWFISFSENWRSVYSFLAISASILTIALATLVWAWLAHPSAARLVSLIDVRGLRARLTRFHLPSLLTLVGASGAIGLLTWLIVANPQKLRGEPLSNFTMLVSAAKMLEMDNPRWIAAFEDQAEQNKYVAPANFDRKNVILILSDALRADRMGVYGYHRPTTPFLSELFENGHLHRVDMALSTCSESFCGIASSFASRPYHEISNRNFRLNALLKTAGYKIRFFLTGDHRSWGYLREFYGKETDQFFDYQSLNMRDLHDDRPVINSIRLIEPYNGQPNFMYFFLMSTHFAGVRLPEFQRYQPANLDTRRLLTFWNELAGKVRINNKIAEQRLGNAELEALSNRYDNGVLQFDGYLRWLFRLLGEKGYLKNSIVVILGDHGDALGEKGNVGHTRTLYQEEIRIPLLIYDLDKDRYRNSQFATQIDVAPTIVERLGLPVPASWRGESLLKPSGDRITYHQTRRGTACFAVVERTAASLLKYMRCGDTREEVYDLVKDPTEQQNLAATLDRSVMARLRSADARRTRNVTTACTRFECVD